MKYALLITIIIFGVISIILSKPNELSFHSLLFLGFITLPYIWGGYISYKRVKDKNQSRLVPIVVIVSAIPANVLYFDAFNYSGTDGQAGLIFAVVPIYQIIFVGLVGFFGYIINRLDS